MKRFFLFWVALIATSSLWAQDAPDYFCLTANDANASVRLNMVGSPTMVSLEYSRDGSAWTAYAFGERDSEDVALGDLIALTNVGDRVFFRNASDGVTGFSRNGDNFYRFATTGSLAASGNVMSLVDKGCAATAIPGDFCFYELFAHCEGLTAAPALPAVVLKRGCYEEMFRNCSSLAVAPALTG